MIKLIGATTILLALTLPLRASSTMVATVCVASPAGTVGQWPVTISMQAWDARSGYVLNSMTNLTAPGCASERLPLEPWVFGRVSAPGYDSGWQGFQPYAGTTFAELDWTLGE